MSEKSTESWLGKLEDGRHVIRATDGSIRIEPSRTDRARLDAQSDADIDAAMSADADWQDENGKPLAIDWSNARVPLPPKKQAISIRLDQDVLDFLKTEGPGYQKRINAVLRHYVSERRKRA